MTMKLRPTRYRSVARQGHSAGSAVLRLPFLELWEQIVPEFAREVVRYCYVGREVEDVQTLLEDAGLGHQALRLKEWFGDCAAPTVQLNWQTSNLLKLAEIAEDLADDDGDWRDATEELDDAVKDAIDALRERSHQLILRVYRQYGLRAAIQTIGVVRAELDNYYNNSAQADPWSAARSDELLKLARQLRGFARPRAIWARLLTTLRPNTSPRLWLADSQRGFIERQTVPKIQRAAELRYEHQRRTRERTVRDAVLGCGGQSGILDDLLDHFNEERQFFLALVESFAQVETPPSISEPGEIQLVTSLETVIDASSRRTIRDLYNTAIRNAGCSAKKIADRLQQDGLPTNGRKYLPAEWSSLGSAVVQSGIRNAVVRHLGAEDLDAPLDIRDPKSAFEHAASITLLSPALRSLLVSVIPVWYRQSKPYAEFHPIAGDPPQNPVFLYCSSPDRVKWKELLLPYVTPVNTAAAGDEVPDSYATKSPHVAVLAHFAMARPLGALKRLPSWMRQGNVLRRQGKFPPLHDRSDHPELRLLHERPTDCQDSDELFDAAVKGHVVCGIPETTPERFTVAGLPRSVQEIFAPDLAEPAWHDATVFHGLLKKAAFADFVTTALPNLTNFWQEAERLALEHDSESVAARLVAMNVLQSVGPQHYCLNLPVGSVNGTLPRELVHHRRGPLVGLTRDEFISRLHSDDDLYNFVFWRVRDLVDLEKLTPNDVPEFVRTIYDRN